MMPRGKNGYSWELTSGTQDSEVRLNSYKLIYFKENYTKSQWDQIIAWNVVLCVLVSVDKMCTILLSQ